jgi:DNA-binding response OmpR family regulator
LLLHAFFNNVGILLSRQQLIDQAFGMNYEGFDRNIDSYIKKLRKKIENDASHPQFLLTKYGAGYVFEGELK